jgi:branched-chain amino acid transport system substrate-binding protein
MCLGLGTVLLITAACGSTSSSSAGNANTTLGPVAMGQLFEMTGQYPFIGTDFLHGSTIGVDEVNNNGGILGGHLDAFLGDTAFEVTEAVPAMRQLLTHHLNFMLGPVPLEYPAIKPLVDQAKIPDFAYLTNPVYDTQTDPWTYRSSVSDSIVGRAMAYYAVKQGLTKCALLFGNAENDKAIQGSLTDSYQRNGGSLTDAVNVVQDQTSYRSEVTKVFSNNPQCVFITADEQTTATLFANASDLGHLTVPFVGSDVYTNKSLIQAIGLDKASKVLTAVLGTTPAGPSIDHFTTAFHAKYGTDPDYRAAAMYDSVIVAALAMTEAKSSDPSVWASHITSVTGDESAQEVHNYADGVTALKAGKKIDYEGASGPMDFDKYHSVFTGETIVKFDASGNQVPALQVSADALLKF